MTDDHSAADFVRQLAAQEQRISHLECHARRLRAVCALALTAACALPLLAFVRPQSTEDEVRTRALRLLDGAGHVRAQLFVDEANPSFDMLDANGQRRVRVFVKGVEPAITLLDAKGHTRVGLAVDSSELPHAVMYDELQRPRFHLAMGTEGLGSATAIDQSGVIRAGFGIDAKAGPWLLPAPSTAPSKPEAKSKAPAAEPPADPHPDKHEVEDR